MKKIIIGSLILVLALFLLVGCTDISGSAKAGNFGNSAKDKAALEYFGEKYGDLTEKGSAPRILEPLVTTSIVDYIPADIVSKYSKDVKKFYVWFVYDNFNDGDTIEIKWTYNDTGDTIYTFSSKTGSDLGRGSFVLEQPDGGWPLGSYSVTLKGRGVTETVDFEVIDGATVSEDITFDSAKNNDTTDDTTDDSTTTAPATTAEATSDSMIFDTTDAYIGACSLTDTSNWTLESALDISLLQIWYNWSAGESTITFTLTKDGANFASGTMARADCDPYQGNWCNGNYVINKDFPAGSYELKVSSKKMCLKPGFTGAVRLYGKTISGNAQSSTEPATTAEATSDSMIFDTTDAYIGACSLTDTAEWTLDETLQISLIQSWYNWSAGESTITFTLTKDGANFASGTMARADCDPYQSNWCNGNYSTNKEFSPGKYVLKVSSAKMCLKPGYTGAVRLYGTRSGSTAGTSGSATAEVGTTTASGFTIQTTNCSFEGDWSSNWGAMSFTQIGSVVTAEYTHDQGKINAVLNNNVLIGTWSEYPSYAPPGDAGDAELLLSSDCKSFTGNWRYGSSGNWAGDWTGTKIN